MSLNDEKQKREAKMLLLKSENRSTEDYVFHRRGYSIFHRTRMIVLKNIGLLWSENEADASNRLPFDRTTLSGLASASDGM